eukprot:15080228-Ditylum_brightwellii.AAC.2
MRWALVELCFISFCGEEEGSDAFFIKLGTCWGESVKPITIFAGAFNGKPPVLSWEHGYCEPVARHHDHCLPDFQPIHIALLRGFVHKEEGVSYFS